MGLQALGLIETIGLVGSIEAADAALKAAEVSLVEIAQADAGISTVKLVGEVSAVKAAVDAGAAAAKRISQLSAAHVIPRPDDQVDILIETVPEMQSYGSVDVLKPTNENEKVKKSK
jgi:ethanolamine utilization protein EutM